MTLAPNQVVVQNFAGVRDQSLTASPSKPTAPLVNAAEVNQPRDVITRTYCTTQQHSQTGALLPTQVRPVAGGHVSRPGRVGVCATAGLLPGCARSISRCCPSGCGGEPVGVQVCNMQKVFLATARAFLNS